MWALGPTPRDNCILVLDWAAVYLCFVYMEGVELVIWRYTQLTVCNREAGCLYMAPLCISFLSFLQKSAGIMVSTAALFPSTGKAQWTLHCGAEADSAELAAQISVPAQI